MVEGLADVQGWGLITLPVREEEVEPLFDGAEVADDINDAHTLVLG